MNCRECRWYQTDHDNEWCETGELNRQSCHDAARRIAEVMERYRQIDRSNYRASQNMRTVGHSR